MAGSQPKPWTPREEAVGNFVIQWMSRANTWIFRATGGRLGNRFRHGAPVLLLVTRGRKTGEPRTAPLLYLQDAGRVVVVASKGGMKNHPAWYLNLCANPEVEIQIGSTVRAMRARTASADEKRAVWPKLVAMYPDYADYQARTTRDIPVVFLEDRA